MNQRYPKSGISAKMLLCMTLLMVSACITASPLMGAGRKHTADMKWWKHDRFGMFIHWGVYSEAAGYWHGKPVGGAGEWLMNNAHLTRKAYATLAPKFDPVKFNADKWVSIAKAAGMKYIVITTKHHDGFCMFNTKATKYNIMDDTPWHTDPMKLLAAACKKQGIRFCTYYSVQDWHSRYTLPHSITNGQPNWQGMRFVAPDGGKEYVHYMQEQLSEIITQYHPGIIWFDNPGSLAWTTPNGVHVAGWTRDDAASVFHFVRKLDPTVIIDPRLGYGFGDYGTPEQHIPNGGIRGNWETCMTINGTWGFKRQDKNFKSSATLITNLIKCASGGGNYLLNVGPTGLGVIPQPEVDRLMAVGRWLKVNGAAIYGSHRTPFKTAMPWGYITSKPGKLFLEITKWSNRITVPMANKVTKAYMLDTGKVVRAVASPKGVVLHLADSAPDAVASVVVLEFSGPVKPL